MLMIESDAGGTAAEDELDRAEAACSSAGATSLVRAADATEADWLREARRKVGPLGIEGDAWDIAQAVLFIASDEARFINGVHLAVDGGVEGIGPMVGHAFIAEA